MSTHAHTLALDDREAFAALAEPHRRELHVHCYRMLASFDDAQDVVQETFLRAWRKRSSFAGRASFRAWLYGIATNACLDAIERRKRTISAARHDEVTWLQPYPDELLDAAVTRETIELAFLVAVQHMAPRQRAVFVLRDVAGLSAQETAAELGITVAAANSALQRARVVLAERRPARADAGAHEREVIARFVEATERADLPALKALLTADATFTMPPEPGAWHGPDAIVDGWAEGGFGTPEWSPLRCRVVRVNRQPAVANYLDGRPLAVDVLAFDGAAVAEIITFPGSRFRALGIPETPA